MEIDGMNFKLRVMKRCLFFVCAVLLLTLSGCGLVSFGYNYAGAYLRYSINSYATFNDAQKETIRKNVNHFMAWHRKEMLPAYAGFLQDIQKAVQSEVPLTAEDVRRYRIEVRTLYIKTLLPTIAPAAKLLSEVDDEQVQEFVESFAKENQKQKDKELGGSKEEQLRKRGQRTIDFLENLVGGFNDNQLEAIREKNRELPFTTAIYLAQRENNQARLIELLKNNRDEAVLAAFLNAWLYTPDAHRSIEERNIIQAFESGADEMIANVYHLLNDRQKSALLKSIAKYIDTFQELASTQ